MNKYLTEKETAAYLRITPGALRKSRMSTWRSHLKFPPFTRIGGSIRYSFEELQKWLEINTVRL